MKTVVVYVEPENVNQAIAAQVLDVSETTFKQLVRQGDITAIKIPGMRRTTYSLAEIRALANRWRTERDGDQRGSSPTRKVPNSGI